MDVESESSSAYESEALSEEEQAFRQNLLKCIDGIEATGSFATGGILGSYPIPGICVDDGEPIAVPLSEEAAQSLASKSDKPPFDERRGTLVDGTVRETLRISPERITFRNPQWDGSVDKLVERVVQELGVPPPDHTGTNVRAELCEHLLCEPGAIFKSHKDTEKRPGMFGTLVICLPSEHTGGTVCLQHGEDSLELSTAETSAYGTYYLAWYTDVTHEVKPVQTGYRWVLMYNLIIDHESPPPSASMPDSQIQSLVTALSRWKKLQHPPNFLIYHLDQPYTSRDLRLSSLKGLDYPRVRYLADSCDRHGGFYMFLAQLDEDWSWPNGKDESDVTCQQHLSRVCSLEGLALSPLEVETPPEVEYPLEIESSLDAEFPLEVEYPLEVEIKVTSLLNCISYERPPVVRREYIEEQVTRIVKTFSAMVVVVVPTDSLHAPLFDPGKPQTAGKVIEHLRAIINDSNETIPRNILLRLCRMILDEGIASGAANDAYLGHVAVTAAFLGDRPLFREAREKTLKAWKRYCWSALGRLIDPQNPQIEEDDILGALKKCGRFRGIYKRLTHFYNGFRGNSVVSEDPAKVEYCKQWYSDRLTEMLDACDNCRGEGVAATIREIAVDLNIQYTPEQRTRVDEAITGFVDRFRKVKEFVNALNVELLLELSNQKNVRNDTLRDLFDIILDSAISEFDYDLYYAQVGLHDNTDGLIRDFYHQAFAHDKKLAFDLLQQLSSKVSNAKKDTVRGFLWSLMEELLPSVDTDSEVVQTCFQSLVKAFITKTVDEEPLQPENWARPAEVAKCYARGCKACPELNLFLKDPQAKRKSIALTAAALEHVKLRFRHLDNEEGSRDGDVLFTKTFSDWEKHHHDWESVVRAKQWRLQLLPQDALKRALGDKYDTLMALDLVRIHRSTAQASDEVQPPSRPKRPRAKDANDTASVGDPKRRRLNEEQAGG